MKKIYSPPFMKLMRSASRLTTVYKFFSAGFNILLKRRRVCFAIIFSLFIFSAFYSGGWINALSEDDIVFPVAELGGCVSKDDCKTYCDNPDNFSACISFAERHNLMSKKEIEMAKKVGGKSGPGGCRAREECETYCNDTHNIRECMAFAEQNGVISEKEIEEGKKVLEALDKGVSLPGGCRNKDECETYCDNPDNMAECIAFAEAAGFIPKEELEMAKKMIGKTGPGGCRGRQCETYCEDEAHIEECLAFAEENGFILKEEAEMARKTGGKGPGGCKGKKECETYCENEEHFAECLSFAEQHGFISKEEAKNARLTGGRGPGGCKGNAECKTYCDNPDNFEECLSFAEKSGMMSKEEAEIARKAGNEPGPGGCRGRDCERYCKDEAHREECFVFAETRGFIPKEEIEKMKKDMETFHKGGPGGCRAREECEAYCELSEHSEECFNFAEKNHILDEDELIRMRERRETEFRAEFKEEFERRKNEIMEKKDGFNFPCGNLHECEAYCADPSHRDECAKFLGGQNSGTSPGEIFRNVEPGIESEFRIKQEQEINKRMLETQNNLGAPFVSPSAEDIEEMMQIERQRIESEMMQKMLPPDGSQIPIPLESMQQTMPLPSEFHGETSPSPEFFYGTEPIKTAEPLPSSFNAGGGFLGSVLNILFLIF